MHHLVAEEAAAQLECAKRLVDHLSTGAPAGSFAEKETPHGVELFDELGLITAKPILYCANVDEGSLAEDNRC